MRLAGDVLKENTETSAFVGDAISSAVNNPNPMMNQLMINMDRQSDDPDITRQLQEKQLYEMTSAQLPFN